MTDSPPPTRLTSEIVLKDGTVTIGHKFNTSKKGTDKVVWRTKPSVLPSLNMKL